VSEGVLVAVITGMVAMYGVTIPLLLSTRKHAKTASDQVTNAHETNLRDDLDEKHSDNAGRIFKIERRVGGVERGVRRIEDHLGIERTQQPNRRKK
jgi:hypothetical protein